MDQHPQYSHSPSAHSARYWIASTVPSAPVVAAPCGVALGPADQSYWADSSPPNINPYAAAPVIMP
jgi:hypothetical protein